MTTTTNLKLSTPAHGSNADTWDADPVNNNSLIIDAVAGSVTAKSLTNANVTLSATESRVSILRFTGALSGNVTINVSAVIKSWVCENLTTGAFTVRISGGSGNIVALPPGSSQVYWDGTNASFMNLGRIGTYCDHAVTLVPAWITDCSLPPALKCDGSSFSGVTYPLLAAILGSTTLPDFKGRFGAYLDDGANRITTAGCGIDGNTRFAAGGEQTHTLITAELASHSHHASGNTGGESVSHRHASLAGDLGYGPGFVQTNPAGSSFGSGSSSSLNLQTVNTGLASADHVHGFDFTSDAAGSGSPHNNVPPTIMAGIRMIWAM